ncbi:hypothetical protein [Mesonia mobilis]|uniref:hypothetical protein n=1 Tax=Mesonia mobilis TaxID=369791 RepID=UPI0026EBDA6D|nr:hypothetical protein [Mesonia mobilis]
MLLEKSKFVTAHKVKSQLTFYEDSNGAIKYGKNPEVEDRYLLIRPDVTFFDANNNPILLIELVITHKVKEEKKIKLRRLGIDTISIIVPKSSAQEIEDNFKTTKRVKWEYNGIEADTEYIRVSSRTSEGVLELDEDQRRIFEESIICRKARLNNTLRAIKNCLRSESYRRVEHNFESEISRIESATKAEREGLEQMEKRFEREIYARFEAQIDELERRREDIEKRKNSFKEQVGNLETRYFSKRKEFDKKEADLSRSIREHSDIGEASERIRAESRIRKSDIEAKSESIRNDIDRIRREIKDLPTEFKWLEIDAEEKFDDIRRKLEKEERDIKSEIDNFGEFANQKKRNLEIEFEKLRERSVERINKRDSKGDSELSKRIKAILDVRRVTTSYDERLKTYERYKTYLALARGRAWEK